MSSKLGAVLLSLVAPLAVSFVFLGSIFVGAVVGFIHSEVTRPRPQPIVFAPGRGFVKPAASSVHAAREN